MVMPIEHNPEFRRYFNDDTDSMLHALWDFFPAQMVVVNVGEPNNFIIEAINTSQQTTLHRKPIGVGDDFVDIFPASLKAEVIENSARCVAEGAPVRFKLSDGYINGVSQLSSYPVILIPIAKHQGITTHLLCVAPSSGFDSGTQPILYSEQEVERRVKERTDELVAINHRLSYLATHDWLTDVYNRRHLLEMATIEFNRVGRYGLSLGLLMLDIDHFKSINDEQGHMAGDQALKTVAHAIRSAVRECDLVGRYGGDEFIILAPETDIQGVRSIAERLRSTLKSANLSISVGITMRERHDHSIDDVINRADHLLLNAKRNGRNRIESVSLVSIP